LHNDHKSLLDFLELTQARLEEFLARLAECLELTQAHPVGWRHHIIALGRPQRLLVCFSIIERMHLLSQQRFNQA